MSIATAITNAQNKVAAAYTAVGNKGGTLPQTQNLSNLPTAISSIPTGSIPVISSLTVTPTTSQQTITAPSGTDGYSPITVSAVTSSIDANITASNIKKDVSILGVTGTYEGDGGGETDNLPAFVSEGVSTFTDNTITKIRPYAFHYNNSTYSTSPITSVSCQNVTEIGQDAFYMASSLQSVSFPSLVSVATSAFSGCKSLMSFVCPNSMRTIRPSAFNSCTGITEFTISSGVTSIGNSAFNNCTNVEEFNYNATNAAFQTSSSSNGVFNSLGKNKNNLVFNIGNNVESIPAYFLYGTTTATQLPNIATLNIPANNSIASIGEGAFYKCSGLSGPLSFPNITSLSASMQNAFNSTNITSLDLSNLASSNQYMRYLVSQCTKLTTLDLSSLTTISMAQGAYQLAYGCSKLTQVDLSSLSSIAVNSAMQMAFRNCTSLTTLSFPALTSTSFGSYTNQFNNMLQGVTGCTVHFPSNLQSVIGSWTAVTAGFGGTNTTVLFDLAATE